MAALLVATLLVAPVTAQEAAPTSPPAGMDSEAPLQRLQTELDALQKHVERAAGDEKTLVGLRQEIEAIAREAGDYLTTLAPRLKDVQGQLADLGPPPAADAPPEHPTIAQERERLTAMAADLDAAVKTGLLLQSRAAQLVDRVQDERRSAFTRQLLERTAGPLHRTFWTDLAEEAGRGLYQLGVLAEDGWKFIGANPVVLVILMAAVLLFGWLRFRLWRGVQAPLAAPFEGQPRFLRRAGLAVAMTLARALPVLIVAGLVYLSFRALNLIAPRFEALAAALLYSAAIYAVTRALALSLLSPMQPAWRLLPVPETSAPALTRLTLAIAAVFAFDVAFAGLSRSLHLALPIAVAESALASLAIAGLLAFLLMVPFSEPPAGRAGVLVRLRPVWLKLPLWLVVAGITLAVLLGYVALARYLSAQVVVTSSILVALIVLAMAVRALAADMSDGSTLTGRWIAESFGVDDQRLPLVAFLLGTLLNILLLAGVVPLLLLQLGFAWQDISIWLGKVLFGLQLGGYNLSVLALFGAMILFAVVVFVTRLLQRWIEHGVMSARRADAGLAQSLRSIVGYAGFAAAVLLALSHLGLDLTNLAIVAGALSVGIGFGLQSVVNNFVSGLILLVERPVKVGDWVIVSGTEGYVRRISVRATEIETFDRSSVIIPNSELITGKLTNWTLQSPLGRALIRVGTSYGSDPDEVRSTLLECAKAHPKVLQWPAPSASFDNFGASSLDFTLRVFLADINEVISVTTELRTAILKAFRAKGIEIPFPQQDVHVRNYQIAEPKQPERPSRRTPAADDAD